MMCQAVRAVSPVQAPPPPPQFPGPPEALQRMQYSQAPPPQPNAQVGQPTLMPPHHHA